MTLGQKIRTARIERGMTQKQLVGNHITRNMLSKIENDSATPSVRTLEYIASRLGLPAGYFMADSRLSDGTSPDGLDDMRRAYKEGRYTDCIALLEESKDVGTTDEGYLLHARASLAAAHESLKTGDVNAAKEFADAADYYNREGIYYSAAVDAEMSLILAECALTLNVEEFEENAREYERAVKEISFSERYMLARAEYLLLCGEYELAARHLDCVQDAEGVYRGKKLFLSGVIAMEKGDITAAVSMLTEAEVLSEGESTLLCKVYRRLEQCYVQLEDFKMAHTYAARQLRNSATDDSL